MSAIPGLMADILALVDCLDAEFKRSGMPEPCFLGVLPGEAVPLDYCDECQGGMAWVRLVGIESGEETTATRCYYGPQRATVELGVIRGAVTMGADGTPPTAADQLDAFKFQMAGTQAMFATLACCKLPSGANLSNFTYAPMGPEGGCVGGTYTAVVEVT